jgi:hypothetical protein
MGKTNQPQLIRTAERKGWYCRFDRELLDFVSCDPSADGAKPDALRASHFMRTGRERGPEDREAVMARKAYYRENPLKTS